METQIQSQITKLQGRPGVCVVFLETTDRLQNHYIRLALFLVVDTTSIHRTSNFVGHLRIINAKRQNFPSRSVLVKIFSYNADKFSVIERFRERTFLIKNIGSILFIM